MSKGPGSLLPGTAIPNKQKIGFRESVILHVAAEQYKLMFLKRVDLHEPCMLIIVYSAVQNQKVVSAYF